MDERKLKRVNGTALSCRREDGRRGTNTLGLTN
jgi:hypothetical protein